MSGCCRLSSLEASRRWRRVSSCSQRLLRRDGVELRPRLAGRAQIGVLIGREHQRERARPVRRGHVVVAAIALDAQRDRRPIARLGVEAGMLADHLHPQQERRLGAGELVARRRDRGHVVEQLLLRRHQPLVRPEVEPGPDPQACRRGGAGQAIAHVDGVLAVRHEDRSLEADAVGQRERPLRQPGLQAEVDLRHDGRIAVAAGLQRLRLPRLRARSLRAARAAAARVRAAPAARRSASRGSGASAVLRRCRRRSRRGRWRPAIRAARPARRRLRSEGQLEERASGHEGTRVGRKTVVAWPVATSLAGRQLPAIPTPP